MSNAFVNTIIRLIIRDPALKCNTNGITITNNGYLVTASKIVDGVICCYASNVKINIDDFPKYVVTVITHKWMSKSVETEIAEMTFLHVTKEQVDRLHELFTCQTSLLSKLCTDTTIPSQFSSRSIVR